MEESNKINKIFEELYEMYIKIKVEIKCLYDNKSDKVKQETCFDPLIKYIIDKMESVQKGVETYIKLLCMKISLHFEQTKILITSAEHDPCISLEKLNNALLEIEEYRSDTQVTYLYFKIINFLSYYHAKIQDLEEARKMLEKAEDIYINMTQKSEMLVYTTDELFENIVLIKSNPDKFEKLINNNFQIQAWVYNRLSMSKKFIIYHHKVLNRQLETHDGNAIAWFYKCIRLAVYFFSNCQFNEARHHLSAAYSVLREYELELLKFRSEPYFPAEWNNLKRYYADMGKYWIKYGLFLFNASRQLVGSEVKSDMNMNDLFIQSFHDSPSTNARREWYSLSKDSKLFISESKETITSSLTVSDKQENENINIENEAEDRNEQKIPELNINEVIKLETEKEVKKDTELKDATKVIIEALEEQQKKIQSSTKILNEEDASGDQKTVQEIKCSTKSNEQLKSASKTSLKESNEINKSTSNLVERDSEENDKDSNGIKTAEEEKNNVCTNEQSKSTSQSILQECKEINKTNPNVTITDNEQNNNNTNLKEIKEVKLNENQEDKSNKYDNVDYDFKFPSLQLALYEKQITTDLIKNTEQARDLFLYAQEWVKRSKSFYTIQEYPHEYIQLILDLNDLYYYLSLFEIDIESQYDVLRRRVEILESLSTLLKEIRPQEYLFLSVELLQELTQSQIDLLMLNIRRLTNVQSAGEILLKDICQGHNDATRKVEALLEIQRRLGRRDSDTKMSLIDMQLFR